MTKVLMLFPPQWSPIAPHLAPASIVGTLRRAGHTCHVRDFNVEFYDEILSSDYLKQIIARLFNESITLQESISKQLDPNKKEDEYPLEFQIMVKKLLRINDLRNNRTKDIKDVLGLIDEAVSVFKDKENFYDFHLLSKAMTIVDMALSLVSLSEYPQEITLHNFSNEALWFNWSDIREYCSKRNMFSRFYEENLDIILAQNYELITISVSSSTQLLAALTLSKILKERTNAKICLGGNHISRVPDALKNNPDFFKIFADYVILEEGEGAILELLENYEKKKKITDVSSLVWLDKSNKVIINEKKPPIKLSDLAPPDLEGFPRKRYYSPEIVMPIQASRGCYWKKCTFCDHDFGQAYNVKSIDVLINEIKYFGERFGIYHFEFTDEAISPNYLENFSRRVVEEGLKIYWCCDLRTESGLSAEIFKAAYEAGLRMVFWGFESGSRRIMELINKGVDFDDRTRILKDASDAGIWNFAYMFFGFPTETYEEAIETMDAICNNTDIFHSYGRSMFMLGKHAIINSDPEKFSIKKLPDAQEFSSVATYEILNGLSQEEMTNLAKEFLERSSKSYKSPAWLYIHYREPLFLYICKYGAEYVKNLEVKAGV